MTRYFLFLYFFSIALLGQNQVRLDSLENALKTAKSPENKTEIYSKLIEGYLTQDLVKALAYAEQLKQFAVKNSNNELLDKALRNIYNTCVLAGDLEKAEQTLQELQSLYNKTQNPKTQNVILSGKARLFLEKAEYKNAIETYQEAIAFNIANIKNDTDYELYLAGNRLNYAITLMSWAHIKKASESLSIKEEEKFKKQCLNLMKQSLAFRERENDITEATLVYNNLAVLYRVFPNNDSVLYYSKRALDLAKTNNDSQKTAIAYTSLATFYYGESQFSKSIDYLNKALTIYQHLGDQKQIGNVLCEKAKNYIWTEQYDEAIIDLEKANILFEKVSYKQGVMMVEELLRDAYEEKKDFENAYHHYQNYVALQTEILSEKNMKDIAWVRAKYDSENRERKIVELDNANLEKEKKIKKNFYTILLLIATIIIVVLLVILLIMRNKNKKKKHEIEKQEMLTQLKEGELKSTLKLMEIKEITKQKIAYELHDRLGVMLATVKLYVGVEEGKLENKNSKNNLGKSIDLLQKSIDEVRAISSELASPTLEKFGINTAIKELVQNINQVGNIKVVYEYDDEISLDSQLKIDIYRIVQELLSNAIKHSKANTINLKLKKEDQTIKLYYSDNGVGLSEIETKEKQNIGWKSIYNRINQQKATVEFLLSKGGLSVVFLFPKKTNNPINHVI